MHNKIKNKKLVCLRTKKTCNKEVYSTLEYRYTSLLHVFLLSLLLACSQWSLWYRWSACLDVCCQTSFCQTATCYTVFLWFLRKL